MTKPMATTYSSDVEEYCAAVRGALVDLPGELGEDLLQDLPDHLTEVLAEGEGSLRDRLGDPAAYAEELRAAAGLDLVPPGSAVLSTRLAGVGTRITEIAGRLDVRIGRLAGYPRLRDLLAAVRPGWWVLRGWVVAQFMCGVRYRDSWTGLIPRLGSSLLAGFCVTVVAIAASVWLGRRSLRFGTWPRRVMFAASAVIAVGAVIAAGD